MLAAMATGETTIENFATSQDCTSTLECLRRLGVEIRQDGTTVTIRGVGTTGFRRPDADLDCGNSGTTMRLLAGIVAGQDFDSVLTGDDSLRRRPMNRIADPLSMMGAGIESDAGRAPIKILGKHPLRAIEYKLPVASAQIKSCVLLAGLNGEGETSVIESVPTRDHTERMLRWFGVDVGESEVDGARRVSVRGGSVLSSDGDIYVPADISAAAFFMVAAASLPYSNIWINNLGLNPTRSAIIDVLMNKLGGTAYLSEQREVNNEPVGTFSVKGRLKPQQSNEINGGIVANLIDELPVLAVFGTQLESGLEVRGAAELRVKESDRISAVVENLRRMGADVEEFKDGFRVGRSRLKGARVDSFGDHRIAMAFAVAGLVADGETEIDGAECAAVSFPRFFEELESVVVHQ
jgi:3-phosphoshikimate 1-carboxyvinyltransferase